MFGYEAHHELSLLGKAFTKQFFKMSSTKLYSYYQSCSEGGREGWSQVQRYGDEWNGAITGAPAFGFSHQKGMHILIHGKFPGILSALGATMQISFLAVQHLYSNVVEQTLGCYPPPCEL
jgi:tannase